MKPVWIRYYGLIPMTRRGYLIALSVAGVAALILFIPAYLLGLMPPFSTLWQPDPIRAQHGFFGWVYNHMYWVLLVCLVCQAIDTFLTLRLFAQKEAEQRELFEDDQ